MRAGLFAGLLRFCCGFVESIRGGLGAVSPPFFRRGGNRTTTAGRTAPQAEPHGEPHEHGNVEHNGSR